MVESENYKYALHECRRQLAALLHLAPGMAYHRQMDGDWTMEFLSEGCHALTGYRPQDLVHNACATYASLIHPEDRPLVYDAVADAVGAKRSFQIEYRIITAGGVEKWVLEKGQAIFSNKTDGFTFIEGFISDITEQKRSEALLKDEIAQQRLLVDQSRDGIVIIDQNGKVYEANRQYATMLGYTMEETRELSVWDWDNNFRKETLREMIRSVDGTGDHFETLHKRKDGTFYEVEISTSATFYRGQKLIFCICRDISQRKQAEREREQLITELREALAEINTLRGILPVCSFCKKIRDDTGHWESVDVYIRSHSQADISHGLCPECAAKHYPDIDFDE